MTVSVIMTAWNTARWVNAAIESVVASTYEDLDIVLVDDGSRDGTGVICEWWALMDKRIRFVPIERRGRNGALKVAHELATGEMLCWVDSDDLVDPAGIAKCVAAIDDDHQLVSTRRRIIDADGNDRGVDHRFNSGEPLLLDHAFFHLRLFTADVFHASGGVGDLSAAIDYDMNLRMAEHTEFRRVDEVLYSYRRRPLRMSDGQLQGIGAIEATQAAIERRGLDSKIVRAGRRWRVIPK